MKKKIVGILVTVLLIATAVLPISADIYNRGEYNSIHENVLNSEWSKTLGGSGDDSGWCIQLTSDNGYIIVGETNSFGAGGYDVWLIKIDANGDEIWNQTYGGADQDGGIWVKQTTDGGYIITGYTYSYAVGEYDAWLIKTDNNGDETWNTTFGGAEFDSFGIIFQTADGGYIIQGGTTSFGAGGNDGWLIKTDENGEMMWDQTFGGSGNDALRDMAMTDDGGCILIGHTWIEGLFSNGVVWLIKTDSNGNEAWNKTYKGTWGHSMGTCAQPTNDGGYIIIGQTNTLMLGSFWFGRGDTWLIKTDSNGDKVWEETYGNLIFEECSFYIIQASDGGYILAGFTNGLGGLITQIPFFPLMSTATLLKTDNNGNIEWEEKIGKGVCSYVQETNDGGCITVGATGNPNKAGDLFIFKKDSI